MTLFGDVAPQPTDTATYDLGDRILSVDVLGSPIGQGNLSISRSGHAYHSNGKKLKPWRRQIAEHVAQMAAHRGVTLPIDGPVAVRLTFTVAKPKSAPKRRRTWPVTRPDLDHYIRAALDAISGSGLWVDDSYVVDVHARKCYPNEHPAALAVPGLHLAVYTIREGNPS